VPSSGTTAARPSVCEPAGGGPEGRVFVLCTGQAEPNALMMPRKASALSSLVSGGT